MTDLAGYEKAAMQMVSSYAAALDAAGIIVEVSSEERPDDAYIGSEVQLHAKRADGAFVGVEEQWIRTGASALSLEAFCVPLRDFLDELVAE